MKQIITLCLLTLSIPSLLSQTLDATISINGSNKLVITINSPASFQFNQTVNGGAGFSLIIDEVYSVDPPALTTNPISGEITYSSSNGNAGSVSQMGPFGFNFGAYTIRDDELTFPTPTNPFNSGDVFTIQPGTIISNAAFGSPPGINAGPYNAFIVSDDYNTVAATQIILPVELTKFDGVQRDDKVHLSWETASENNNKGFEIEHSTDGITWRNLGFQLGKGNSTNSSQYDFLHTSPQLGFNYYRLKQLDFDGIFEYSNIINIPFNHEDGDVGEFYPNPSKSGLVSLDFYSSHDDELTFSVFDMSGKLMVDFTQSVSIGNNHIYFDFSDLQTGIYIVKIGDKRNSIHRKLIIEVI